MNPTLALCLIQLKEQGVFTVREAGTNNIITINEALTRVNEDGTADTPARLATPEQQRSRIPKEKWWHRSQILAVNIPGHVFQILELQSGEMRRGETVRFYYESTPDVYEIK